MGFVRARGGPAVPPPPRASRARRGTRLACRSLSGGGGSPLPRGFPPQGFLPPLGGFPPAARALFCGPARAPATAAEVLWAGLPSASLVPRWCLGPLRGVPPSVLECAPCPVFVVLCWCCVASGGGPTVLRARSCVGVWGLPLPRGLCWSPRPGNAGGWLVAGVGFWFVCAWFGVGGVWLCLGGQVRALPPLYNIKYKKRFRGARWLDLPRGVGRSVAVCASRVFG